MAAMEYVVVGLVVGLAAAYLARRAWRTRSGACGGCHGDCATDTPRDPA